MIKDWSISVINSVTYVLMGPISAIDVSSLRVYKLSVIGWFI